MATYVGDTPLIKYNCQESIADLSTSPVLCYRKPDGTVGTWVGTITDTNYLQWQTVDGDIDEAGVWEIHPKLTDGSVTYHGSIQELTVTEPVYYA